MIENAFRRAWKKLETRKWDKIYVAVDWHDTICESTYEAGPSYKFIQGSGCIAALQDLTNDDRFCLILFTSSYSKTINSFLQHLRDKYRIFFDYVNENPEVKNTEYGNFDKKFYYDVLIEDKSGFSGDWRPILDWYWEEAR